MDEDKSDVPWPLWQRLSFRFLSAYFVIYIFPFPVSMLQLPKSINWLPNKVLESIFQFWNVVVPWVQKNILHLSFESINRPNGSGDSTFSYVQVLCYAAVAVVVALLWSLVDYRRTNYRTLHRWLRVYVRFYLAATLILYGSVKVIKSQFPNPTLDRLIQPFGDASPMGLLWTFMGASQGYNIFTGAGEMIAALLLTTRRTALLGALLSFGVMIHVTALNFFYDVPVKLFSLHLVAMSVFLAAPDVGRLIDMFFLNRPVAAVERRVVFNRIWLDRACVVLRTLIVAAFVWQHLNSAAESRRMFGDGADRSPFYGIWVVDEFVVEGQPPSPETDATRWRRVIFDNPQRFVIQHMSDSIERFFIAPNSTRYSMTISPRLQPEKKFVINYTQTGADKMTIEGSIDGRSIRASLTKSPPREFLLMNRGFHWINEFPYNR